MAITVCMMPEIASFRKFCNRTSSRLTPECATKTYPFAREDPAILPAIPERVETFILTMTNRRNALTVLGLIFMRVAISCW